MCVAVPMKIKKIMGDEAIVELEGFEKEVNLVLMEKITEGDYVMVHAGFAIQKVDEAEAEKTLETLKEYAEKIREAQE